MSKPFKMKGSPMKRNFGIGADSPMKEETRAGYTGADIDPSRAYDYKEVAKIPSFRDMVSLEQQQAYAKKVDERRFKKKKEDYDKRMEEERPERERQLKADEGELHSELAGMEERERKREETRLANEPIDYDALELPEEELPETKTSYEGATKNEMTDVRKEFKNDGSWDPKNNPEHAEIQNKINELYGSSKKY